MVGKRYRLIQYKRVEKADNKRRDDKFTWTPADVKVQDEDGNWIRCDEFLKQKKPPKSDG